ncbi:glycosyltransferase family 2 protein [Salmonella enterica]
MKNKIYVSVIIPAYNAAETIGSLVNKILSENRVAIELIVIDDGSTDGTANVLRQIHDDRLILIEKANQGVYAARKVLCLPGRVGQSTYTEHVYRSFRFNNPQPLIKTMRVNDQTVYDLKIQ